MKNYFTIEELCKSETAEQFNIDNVPDTNITNNLQQLIEFLNPIRDAWGSALIVTSGYRCERLNQMLGGSDTSAHKLGWAVDLIPSNGKIEEFEQFLIKYVKDNKIMWDQILIEKSGNSTWIHIGIYNQYMTQRQQIKYMFIK